MLDNMFLEKRVSPTGMTGMNDVLFFISYGGFDTWQNASSYHTKTVCTGCNRVCNIIIGCNNVKCISTEHLTVSMHTFLVILLSYGS